MSLASFFNLAGPDLVILALILTMLGGPVVVVLVILRSTHRSRSSPPPLPQSESPSSPKGPEQA
jgi:hypothetical protein